MARKSSDQIRIMNAGIVEQLLTRPADEVTEGSYVLRVLEVRGRITGEPRRVPLGVVQKNGVTYLVSPDPNRDWVRNLTHDPACTLAAGSSTWQCRAGRVAGDEAITVVATYLRAVTTPWALQAFPVAPDASRADIEGALDRLAVFRLDPA
ncbi:nitroreductase/quinone reductase family protein [Actinoplanes sp. NPDC049681]|uniref:nitroreductase/quinone reductase family protein n=1 Tax=Actinoplanes sp. NPDC049681 TaxID=3363905 RepID=UPI00379FF0A4